jgi:hypothetical protein
MAEYLKDGKSENECERQISAIVAAELACAMHCIEKPRELIRLSARIRLLGVQEAPHKGVAHGEQRHAG